MATTRIYNTTPPTVAKGDNPGVTRWTASLMLVQLGCFLVALIVLGGAINWPASLDDPASKILPLIKEQNVAVQIGYTGYLLSALLLIPISLLISRAFNLKENNLLTVSVGVGVAAGVFKILGIFRWLSVMPLLTTNYVDNSSQRDVTALTYDAFNKYGGSIGENLGVMLFTGIWTALVAIVILQSGKLPAWLGWFGLVSAALSLLGLVEVYGANLGPLITVSSALWQLWMVATALVLLTSRRQPNNISQ